MTVWVLFIWMSSTMSLPIAAYTFGDKEECLEFKETYKRSVCLEVKVPHPNRVPKTP